MVLKCAVYFVLIKTNKNPRWTGRLDIIMTEISSGQVQTQIATDESTTDLTVLIGTFPRDREHQWTRIKSNASVLILYRVSQIVHAYRVSRQLRCLEKK